MNFRSNGRPTKWIHSIVVTTLVLVTSVTLFSCGSKEETHSSSIGSADLDVLTLQTVFPKANEFALSWRDDAILTSAHFDIQPLFSDNAPEVSLAFLDQTEPKEYLLVWISPDSEGDFSISKSSSGMFEDARPNAEPIRPETPRLKTYEALSLAFELGAEDFIATQRSIDWPGLLKLERADSFNETGPLRWIVTFESSSRIMHLFIDDQTGELIEERVFTTN